MTPQILTGVQTALPLFQIPRNSTAVSRTQPQVPISIQTHLKGPLLLQSPRAPFHCTTEFHRTHTHHQFFSIKDRLKDRLALCKRKNYPAREDAMITPFVVFHWNIKITLKEMSVALPSPCSLPTEKCINVNRNIKHICAEKRPGARQSWRNHRQSWWVTFNMKGRPKFFTTLPPFFPGEKPGPRLNTQTLPIQLLWWIRSSYKDFFCPLLHFGVKLQGSNKRENKQINKEKSPCTSATCYFPA